MNATENMGSPHAFIPEANGVVKERLKCATTLGSVRKCSQISAKATISCKNEQLKPIPSCLPKEVGHDFKPKLIFSKEELRERLTPMQFRITQERGTERENTGEFVRFSQSGTFSCIVCNVEIFSSASKFYSGSGWPAFKDVLDRSKVVLKPDTTPCGSVCGGGLMALPSVDPKAAPPLSRWEVVCSACGAHIGHLFDDGPKPTGLRYCVNSVALRFNKQVPRETEV